MTLIRTKPGKSIDEELLGRKGSTSINVRHPTQIQVNEVSLLISMLPICVSNTKRKPRQKEEKRNL